MIQAYLVVFSAYLTMGALVGAAYGMLMVQLGLMPAHLVINLVIFSMAGYFAAIIRAPFTAIILITEMVWIATSFNAISSCGIYCSAG